MGTPLNVPLITDYYLRDMTDSVRSGWLTQGKYLQRLEQDIAAYVGTKHAIAVSSGTAALHLSLLAHNIGPGDEVIVPAYSFVATANAVELTGARPVFVDIRQDTLCIDVAKIESAITRRTRAIIPVHSFGLPADMAGIMEIATRNSLAVIEDAACAIGATFNARPVGSFGHVGCFSFHGRKLITCGEGGAVTTDNDCVAKTIRSLRSHGVDKEGRYVMLGYNYRMTDFQAALLIGQLRNVEGLVRKRRQMADIYDTLLDSRIIKQQEVAPAMHSYQSYHIIVPGTKVVQALQARGIEARKGAQFIPGEPYYRQKYGFEEQNVQTVIETSRFPVSHNAYRYGIVIPIYHKLENQSEIIQCINHTVRENT